MLRFGCPSPATGCAEPADRRHRRPVGGDPQNQLHLSLACDHTGDRADYRNSLCSEHSRSVGVSVRAGVCCLAWTDAATELVGGQAQAWWHHQTRGSVSSPSTGPGSAHCGPVSKGPFPRRWPMDRGFAGTAPTHGRCCRGRKQAGADDMGNALHWRGVPDRSPVKDQQAKEQ